MAIGLLLAVQNVAEAQASSSSYRDGAQWVRAEREESTGDSATAAFGGGALRPVRLTQDGAQFRAWVGRRALVQLSAAAVPGAVALFRAQNVRAIAPAWQSPAAAPEATGAPARPAAPALSARWRIYWVEGRAAEDGLDVAARLSRLAGIESAIPDLHIQRKPAQALGIPPDDPRYGGQWYLARLKIEKAWRLASGDPDTTVVVVDDGCDMDHPDLVGAMRGGLDLVDGDDDPTYAPNQQGNEHGTACSGIIAATGDNGIGIAGVCPRCSLRCVRLFKDSHSLVPISGDIAAFDYAFEVGAAVVSNSWGFAEPMPVPGLLRGAIGQLMLSGRDGRGSVVVFAAGNENRLIAANELAAISGVINVGAINNFDEAAPFSNFGDSLALTAPTGTLTTDIAGSDGGDPSDYTQLFGGTSSACPVVAGVAALLLSAAPQLSAREVGDALIATSREAPFAVPDANRHDPVYGYGIVDPGGALRSVLGISEPEEPQDAGMKGADAGGGDGGASKPRKRGEGGGCSVSEGGGGGGGPCAALLALAAARLVRRRRES